MDKYKYRVTKEGGISAAGKSHKQNDVVELSEEQAQPFIDRAEIVKLALNQDEQPLPRGSKPGA